MKKAPLISFIMNCYNGELFLERALKSIINQTYKNWELVFWDNCSTDNSKKIFLKLSDSRFKYFSSDYNVSLGQARAWAVDKCKGEYIAFLDVDDEWMPNKTEIQVKTMIEDDSVLSYSNIREIYDYNKSFIRKSKWKTGYLFSNQLEHFEINLPSSMIKKEILIKKKLNFDPKIEASEEYCLFMQLIYGEKVSVINDILANYYIRRDSLTNIKSNKWSFERNYTLNKIISKHPKSYSKFSKSFNVAYDRGKYYEVRNECFNKNYVNARRIMKTIMFNDWRYFILFILLTISPRLWVLIHDFKTKRG